MDFLALSGQQLHFFLYQREDQHLFVFVQSTVLAHIEHIDELSRCLETQQVIDLSLAPLKDKLDVGFVENALVSEVSLADSVPYFFAFAGATEHGAGFAHQLLAFVLGDIRK